MQLSLRAVLCNDCVTICNRASLVTNKNQAKKAKTSSFFLVFFLTELSGFEDVKKKVFECLFTRFYCILEAFL